MTALIRSAADILAAIGHEPEPEESDLDETEPFDGLLRPCEVAQLFRVDHSTVTRWGNLGRIRYLTTPQGRRRYYAKDVHALLARRGPRPQGTVTP